MSGGEGETGERKILLVAQTSGMRQALMDGVRINSETDRLQFQKEKRMSFLNASSSHYQLVFFDKYAERILLELLTHIN